MVFGGVRERTPPTERGLSVSGHPGYRDLPLDVRKDYPAITGAIAKGDFADGFEAGRGKMARGMLGVLPAARRSFPGLWGNARAGAKLQAGTRYRKRVCRIGYESGGVQFTREIFASHPDEVLVVRLRADHPGSFNFRVRMTSPHPAEVRAEAPLLTMHGQLPGLVLRRTLDWVEQKGDTWKYPDLWDENGRPAAERQPDSL